MIPLADYLIALPVQLVVALWGVLLVSRRPGAEQRYLGLSLAAHLVASVAIILVTQLYFGGGDMMAYHRVGKFLASRLRADFFEFAPDLLYVILQQERPFPIPGMMGLSNTGSLQGVSGFLMLAFGDSLPAACAFIAGAVFYAKLKIYETLKAQLAGVDPKVLLVSCMLLPSAVFWSSGLLKEPIALGGLAMMIVGGYRLGNGNLRIASMLLLAGGVVVVGLFKGYLLPPFGIGAGLWLVAKGVRRRADGGASVSTRSLILAVAIAATAIAATGAWLPQFSTEAFEEEARTAQEIGGRITGGSNYGLGGGSLLTQAPLALVAVFFRPVLFEASSPVLFLNALEMLWITTLVARAIFKRSPMATVRSVLSEPVLAFCVGFVMPLAIGVGINTTNLGTLSRYRTPLMPFYVTLAGVLAAPSFLRRRFGAAVPAPQAVVGGSPALAAQPSLVTAGFKPPSPSS